MENRIELLSVDGQFSVGESSHKRYKEFRIRFFRNCRFGKCNACLDRGRSFGRLQFKMIKNMINLLISWTVCYILTFDAWNNSKKSFFTKIGKRLQNEERIIFFLLCVKSCNENRNAFLKNME